MFVVERMAAGRNRRIAAWAFVATMVVVPGQAGAAVLDTPASTPKVAGLASALPALPGLTSPAIVAPNPVPVPVQPTAAPSAPPPAAPQVAAVTAGVPAQLSRVAVRSRGAKLTQTATTARSKPTARSIAGRPQRTSQTRASRAKGSAHKVLPTYGPSRFDRLGQMVEAGGSPAGFFGDLPDGTPGSGMGWAVPLLAIMLPIGLSGFLQAARGPRNSG
jgi:hypothetical protein